ncbi:MAG TPA: PAS domain-containing protein, partial [Prolixibacteraceae bacterium]|nr:PAS domain-containing protein [Prolixibacteraceae bacterium]
MSRPDENSTLHKLAELRRQNAELKAIVKKMSTEKKYFLLFQKSSFPTILSKLPEGVIVDVNKAFEKEFGFTKQEAIGKTPLELSIAPDEEGERRILEALKKADSVHHHEMVLFTKSGEKLYYENNIDKIIINGEEYLLNTIQNIGEYKRTKNKLKDSKAKYKAIFESVGTATIIVDRDKTILMANNECLNTTGYNPSELIGTKWT